MWPLTLVRICVLQADPQDLPVSTPWTLLTVVVYCFADVATALAVTLPLTQALQAAALDTLLLFALTQATLNVRQQGRRLRQTVMALMGSGAIMAAVTVMAGSLLPEGVTPEFLWALSVLWLFAVYGHILRHAFDVSYAAGIAMTGAYFFVSLFVTAPFLASVKT